MQRRTSAEVVPGLTVPHPLKLGCLLRRLVVRPILKTCPFLQLPGCPWPVIHCVYTTLVPLERPHISSRGAAIKVETQRFRSQDPTGMNGRGRRSRRSKGCRQIVSLGACP